MSDVEPERPSPEAAGHPAELRLVPPEWGEAPTDYANFVQATASPFDLTLHLGWFSTPILEELPTSPVEVPVRPLRSVTIPLTLVRGLITVLEAQLAAAESSPGVVRHPQPSEGSE
jgi:hypothetical protein